ncbi:MAG TPA: TlpA disulfide reductase family protein [Bryobacteraceae bacterium]|nr:TlpA disulfide reductase family protein [Bryobacteraceae bacterium]
MQRFVALVSLLLAFTCAAQASNVPRPSPEYVIRLTTGQQILLSSLRGNVVALMFISTECPHCQQTAQLMDRLYKEYGPKGFRPVAVAFNEMAMMLVPDFIKRHNISFPVGYDFRETVYAYIERSPMLRTYVPILVFIDRGGTIRAQYLGDDNFFRDQEKNIRTMIEQLLREPAGKRTPAANSGAAKRERS